MRPTGAHQKELSDDLALALREWIETFAREPGLWARARTGKWTAGQHAEHVAVCLKATAESLERAESELRRGALRRRPWRGPLQALFVALVVGRGRLPRGGRTPREFAPGNLPVRDDVMRHLSRDVERHRALGERLAEGERDRLWIGNPFMKGWHYSYPEMLRVHAVHLRHHESQVLEIIAEEPGVRTQGAAG